jgi:hypothetical protein
MKLLKEELTEEFIESMVDKVIARLGEKFEQLDISLDFIAGALTDTDAVTVGTAQRNAGRYARMRRPSRGSPRVRDPEDDR